MCCVSQEKKFKIISCQCCTSERPHSKVLPPKNPHWPKPGQAYFWENTLFGWDYPNLTCDIKVISKVRKRWYWNPVFHYSQGTPSHAGATHRKAMGPLIIFVPGIIFEPYKIVPHHLDQTSTYTGTKLQRHFVFASNY